MLPRLEMQQNTDTHDAHGDCAERPQKRVMSQGFRVPSNRHAKQVSADIGGDHCSRGAGGGGGGSFVACLMHSIDHGPQIPFETGSWGGVVQS